MFEQPIARLRDTVASFTDFADDVVVLIDDLDKGWPPRQVEAYDVSMVKHLVEVMNRIQRDLTRRDLGVKYLIFLRSDMYERLVEQTSDRGKYNVIKVDWSDEEQLRHLLKQRVMSGLSVSQRDSAWDSVNPHMPEGDAVSLMIDNSLRRPRFLIDLCERTVSCAVNRGHGRVTEADVREGRRQMSLYLVSDFAYEMRDIAGTPEDILYLFMGADALLTRDDVDSILANNTHDLRLHETVNLLLWYGFLGIQGVSARNPTFIYDVAYDFRRLEAERAQLGENALYAVNPAFLQGLIKAGS
jgi:hypothetical protein